ncbi:MAG: glycosyltransferase family 2 protein, partial [Burkholderiales bacterium]|nr:glycosyltransferase family 2 protein [Opitutaceae bacterium]
MKTFSVIVPTCDRTEALALCLARLAPGAQALPAAEYEVIVTDDSASGKAPPLIRRDFPWARWVPGPRGGPAMNRNHGAEHATGAWLAFVDDDCLPAPGWLSGYLRAAGSRPE